MMGTVQMLAGLAVVLGLGQAIVERHWKPLWQLALPGLAIWLTLGWAFGWASPDY